MSATDAASQIFASLNRPIWIVTAADRAGQAQGGLVATWILQASLDPAQPAVCAGIAPNHFTRELIDSSGHFALHLLRSDQVGLAFPFCQGSAREFDKFAHCGQEGSRITLGEHGSPLLSPVHSVMECEVYARLGTGDRVYFWADVIRAETQASGQPLDEQAFFGELTAAQRAELRTDLDRDVELQSPWQADWRGQLPAELKPRHLEQ